MNSSSTFAPTEVGDEEIGIIKGPDQNLLILIKRSSLQIYNLLLPCKP